MDNKKRIDWIDIAKGIGIILVILGHAPRNVMRENNQLINYIYHFIYSFHMPLFFFLSGYVFEMNIKKYDNTKKYIINKVKKVLLPWFIYSIIIYLLIYIINIIPQFNSFVSGTEMKIINFVDYFKMNLLCDNPYAFHLWFLEILFIVQLICFIIRKNNFESSVGLFIMILFSIIYSLFDIRIFLLRYLIRCIIYYLLGINAYKYLKTIKNKNYILIPSIGFIITNIYIICICLKYVENPYIKFIVYLSEMIIGIPSMIYFVCIMSIKIKNKIIRFLGNNSFSIYLLHQPLCCAFIGTFLIKMLPATNIYYYLIIMICTFFSIIGPMVFTRLCYKIGLGNILNKIGINRI